LQANTTYQWQIIPKNSFGEPTGCEVWTFTTGDDVIYCENGLYSSMEFYNCEFGDEIDDFSIANINHVGSGCSWAGYGDYTENTSLQTELEREVEYLWTASIGLNNQDWMVIWIDFNKDGFFDNSTECLYQSDNYLPSSASGSITIPSDVPLGTTRMRVRIKAQEPQLQCDESCTYFLFGEVHDYTVHITDPDAVPDCSYNPEPSDNAENVPLTGVTLFWTEIANAESYEVYFGTTSLNLIGNTTDNFYPLDLLAENTNYQWAIVPENINGSALGCETWQFSTGQYVGVNSFNHDQRILIYPNPSPDGILTIEIRNSEKKDAMVHIFNSRGETVFAKQLDLSTDHKEQIQLSGNMPGLYIIKMQTSSGIYTEKLIVR